MGTETSPVCTTCGTQFPGEAPPDACPICADERQFVRHGGQAWTTLETLRDEHRIAFRDQGGGLMGIVAEPRFAIGQRALLVPARATGVAARNVLWDCITLIDDATVRIVDALGGIGAIAISHPHYYTTMVEWSRAFGGVPVYIHADEREWVMRSDPAIVFWEGETLEIGDGLTLIRLGGHFPGAQVLHWAAAGDGAGALLSGDILQVVADRRFVSFMYSYPNYIPLSTASVRRMVRSLAPWPFARIYGAFMDAVVEADGKAALHRSAQRYLHALEVER
jgi:glyoxylase-like metal-dependent hydrolase (beta-lactamase superfamily II)